MAKKRVAAVVRIQINAGAAQSCSTRGVCNSPGHRATTPGVSRRIALSLDCWNASSPRSIRPGADPNTP